jgi:hypothetical protein
MSLCSFQVSDVRHLELIRDSVCSSSRTDINLVKSYIHRHTVTILCVNASAGHGLNYVIEDSVKRTTVTGVSVLCVWPHNQYKRSPMHSVQFHQTKIEQVRIPNKSHVIQHHRIEEIARM